MGIIIRVGAGIIPFAWGRFTISRGDVDFAVRVLREGFFVRTSILLRTSMI
jgi:hypothetical protein